MPNLTPISDIYGVHNKEEAEKMITAICDNIGTQTCVAAAISAEQELDPKMVPLLVTAAIEKGKVNMLMESLKQLSNYLPHDEDREENNS